VVGEAQTGIGIRESKFDCSTWNNQKITKKQVPMRSTSGNRVFHVEQFKNEWFAADVAWDFPRGVFRVET
jgi:hypothetical protein